jgi:hypothetical protein
MFCAETRAERIRFRQRKWRYFNSIVVTLSGGSTTVRAFPLTLKLSGFQLGALPPTSCQTRAV